MARRIVSLLLLLWAGALEAAPSPWALDLTLPSGEALSVAIVILSQAAEPELSPRGCLADPGRAPRLRWEATCVALPLSTVADPPTCAARAGLSLRYHVELLPTQAPLRTALERHWTQQIRPMETWRARTVAREPLRGGCADITASLIKSCQDEAEAFSRAMEEQDRRFWTHAQPPGCPLPGYLQLPGASNTP